MSINISKRNTVEAFCGQLLLSFPKQNRTYPVWRFGILEGPLFNECVTGLTSVLSVAPHNGEDEGQLIMYSVPVLWACCIMVKHKRSLCARLPPEPSHIPELLLDTAVPLSEEAPVSPTAPRPPDLPEDPIDMSDQAGESSAPTAAPLFLARNFLWPQMTRKASLHCTPSACPNRRRFIQCNATNPPHSVSQRSHKPWVSPLKERMRSRGGNGSERKDKSRGNGSKRKREKGSCKN